MLRMAKRFVRRSAKVRWTDILVGGGCVDFEEGWKWKVVVTCLRSRSRFGAEVSPCDFVLEISQRAISTVTSNNIDGRDTEYRARCGRIHIYHTLETDLTAKPAREPRTTTRQHATSNQAGPEQIRLGDDRSAILLRAMPRRQPIYSDAQRGLW